MKYWKLSFLGVFSLLPLCFLSSCSSINNSVSKNSYIRANAKYDLSSFSAAGPYDLGTITHSSPTGNLNFVSDFQAFNEEFNGKIIQKMLDESIITDADVVTSISGKLSLSDQMKENTEFTTYPITESSGGTNPFVVWQCDAYLNYDLFIYDTPISFTCEQKINNMPVNGQEKYNLKLFATLPNSVLKNYNVEDGISYVLMSATGMFTSSVSAAASPASSCEIILSSGSHDLSESPEYGSENFYEVVVGSETFYFVERLFQLFSGSNNNYHSIPLEENGNFLTATGDGSEDQSLTIGECFTNLHFFPKYNSTDGPETFPAHKETGRLYFYYQSSNDQTLIIPDYNFLVNPPEIKVNGSTVWQYVSIPNICANTWEKTDDDKFNNKTLINYLNSSNVKGSSIFLHSLWNTYVQLAYMMHLSGVNVTNVELTTKGIEQNKKGHISDSDTFINGTWNMIFKMKSTTITIKYKNDAGEEKIYFRDEISSSSSSFQYCGASGNSINDILKLYTQLYDSSFDTNTTLTSSEPMVSSNTIPLVYLGAFNKDGRSDKAKSKKIFTIKRDGDCVSKQSIDYIDYLLLTPYREECAVQSIDSSYSLKYPANPNLIS